MSLALNHHQSCTKADQESAKKLYFYFHNLWDRNAHGFADKWDQIPDTKFTSREYAQTLYRTTIYLHAGNITFDLRGEILSHIRTNIDAWLVPALNNIESFNEQNLANTLWSLAVLDSYYSEDSLIKAYEAFIPHVKLTQHSAGVTLKQVRDAKLWFTGQSDIPNPKQNNPKRKLILENNVRNGFKKAGYDVTRPKSPLIAELEQAIDFPVINSKKNQEFWAEVDGYRHTLNLDQKTAAKFNLKVAKISEDVVCNVQTYFRTASERRLAAVDSTIVRIDPIRSSEIEQLVKIDNHEAEKN